MTCDRCPCAATFTVTAAYPVGDPNAVHPLFATYPMPLGRACDQHLPDVMHRDQRHGGASPTYLVRPR